MASGSVGHMGFNLAHHTPVVVVVQGLRFTALPPGLANGTVLEVFDMGGNMINGGPLPMEYMAWTNLTAFK